MITKIRNPRMIITFTLREARLRSGLTQAEIAEKLGMHEKTYQKYESYKQVLRIDQGVHFSEITKVPFERIVFFYN